MKYSEAMLKGFEMAGFRKARHTRQADNGSVCALGAAALALKGSAHAMPNEEDRARIAFLDAYGTEIAFASNGDDHDPHARTADNGRPGLPVDVIAGMLKAIGH